LVLVCPGLSVIFVQTVVKFDDVVLRILCVQAAQYSAEEELRAVECAEAHHHDSEDVGVVVGKVVAGLVVVQLLCAVLYETLTLVIGCEDVWVNCVWVIRIGCIFAVQN
jgi:hypothetical protein